MTSLEKRLVKRLEHRLYKRKCRLYTWIHIHIYIHIYIHIHLPWFWQAKNSLHDLSLVVAAALDIWSIDAQCSTHVLCHLVQFMTTYTEKASKTTFICDPLHTL